MKVIIFDSEHKSEIKLEEFSKEKVSFGRESSQDIVIKDSNASRRHGFFFKKDGIWYVSDAGSTNGISVNGNPVTGVQDLYTNDYISLSSKNQAQAVRIDVVDDEYEITPDRVHDARSTNRYLRMTSEQTEVLAQSGVTPVYESEQYGKEGAFQEITNSSNSDYNNISSKRNNTPVDSSNYSAGVNDSSRPYNQSNWDNKKVKETRNNTGLIIGIISGAVLLLVVIIVLLIWNQKLKNRISEVDHSAETTEATTITTTEATTETTTEEQNEAERLGYTNTFIHKTEYGGNYAIPDKFKQTNEENVETGLWYEFTDSNTGIILETWENPRRTRKTDYLENIRDNITSSDYIKELDEENKIRYSGQTEDSKSFVEIVTLQGNVYHSITIKYDDDKKELCSQIADIVDSNTEYVEKPDLLGRLPLLLYGGTFPLSDDEIKDLSDDEVIEAINEIYAYKGFIFEDQELLDYFGEYGWYNPSIASKDFSDDIFNDTEKENLKKLRERKDYTPSGIVSNDEVPAVSGERFEMVRGGSYYVPDGFDNITKETYAVRYVQEWQNYSLDMYITVTNCMQIDIPMSLEDEYDSYLSSYNSSSELSLNTKDEDGYIISGTRNSDQRIFYHKVKHVEDRYVSFYIEYPASNANSCNQIVESFVSDFDYYN